MSRMRHASASREKHGSSSLPAGQEPVYFIEAATVGRFPIVTEYTSPHSPILKGLWQPDGISSPTLHSAETSSEQSVLA